MKIVKDNSQIAKIKARDLERPAKKSSRYDSTIDERARTHMDRKPEPRLTEYR